MSEDLFGFGMVGLPHCRLSLRSPSLIYLLVIRASLKSDRPNPTYKLLKPGLRIF